MKNIIFSGPNPAYIRQGTKTQTRRICKAQPAAEDLRLIEIVDPSGKVSYRRPAGHKLIEVAGSTPGYTTRTFLEGLIARYPYGRPGDWLGVREAFYIDHLDYLKGPLPKTQPVEITDDYVYYPADAIGHRRWCCQMIAECSCGEVGRPRARSPYHIPRWLIRTTIEITALGVEQIQDITDEGALAEGIRSFTKDGQLMKYWQVDPQVTCLRKSDPLYVTWQDMPLNPREAFARAWDAMHGRGAWDRNDWVDVLSFKVVNGGVA